MFCSVLFCSIVNEYMLARFMKLDDKVLSVGQNHATESFITRSRENLNTEFGYTFRGI